MAVIELVSPDFSATIDCQEIDFLVKGQGLAAPIGTCRIDGIAVYAKRQGANEVERQMA